MRTTIDALGRIVIPKALREELGLVAGSELDVSRFGGGVHVEPRSRAARVEPEGERLVIVGDSIVDDTALFALIDAGRR